MRIAIFWVEINSPFSLLVPKLKHMVNETHQAGYRSLHLGVTFGRSREIKRHLGDDPINQVGIALVLGKFRFAGLKLGSAEEN